MTNQEALDKINALTTQVGKVLTEVQALIATIHASGNVTPEIETALVSLQTTVQGVDDLSAHS